VGSSEEKWYPAIKPILSTLGKREKRSRCDLGAGGHYRDFCRGPGIKGRGLLKSGEEKRGLHVVSGAQEGTKAGEKLIY